MPDIQTEAEEHLAKLKAAKELVEDDLYDEGQYVDQADENVRFARDNRDEWDTQSSYEMYVSDQKSELAYRRSKVAALEKKKKELDDLILKMMDVVRHAKARRN